MALMGYGDVKEYIRGRAGAVDLTTLEVLMVQALQDMWADIGQLEALASTTLTLTSGTATYDVPATTHNLLSIVDENGCPLARHEPRCVMSRCTCSVIQYQLECEMAYTVVGSVITFYPTPTQTYTYTVKAYGEIDTTLSDLDGADVVWRYVALPEGLHRAYANRVLGMAVADADPGRAQIWLGFSNQSFDNWKRRFGASGEAAGEAVIFNGKGIFNGRGPGYRGPWDNGNTMEVFQRVSAP